MNIQAFTAAARAAANATGTNAQGVQPRQHSQSTPQNAAIPREAAERPPEARPVLELSDTTLTRRDVPRGSLIDIIA